VSKLGKYKKKKQKNSKKFKNKKSFKKSSWYPLKSVLFCKMLEIKTFAPFQLLMAKTSTSFSWEKWSFFLWFFFPLMFYANHSLPGVLFSFDEANDPLWMILCFFLFFIYLFFNFLIWVCLICFCKWCVWSNAWMNFVKVEHVSREVNDPLSFDFFPLMFYANHFLLVVLFSFDEVNDPLWMILCFFFYLFIWVGLICGLQVMCLIKWFYFTFRLLYFCPLCVHSFN